MLNRLRPNVLSIAALLSAVCIVDILADGNATVGLAAAGALAAIAKDIISADGEER